jgi:valyl-tRNA synthetase
VGRDQQLIVQCTEFWVVARNNEELHANVVKELTSRNLPDHTAYKAHQDEDVLDTWFSSGLLPLSASGWTGPGTTAVSLRLSICGTKLGDCNNWNLSRLQQRYPLDVMETGLDILFFWVARMAMLCTHLNGQPPFKDVFLHAMVSSWTMVDCN